MSHKAGVSDGLDRSIPGSIPLTSKTPYDPQQRMSRTTTTTQRLSMASSASSTRRSTSSCDSVAQISSGRPSAIPRAASAKSQARLSILAASRPVPAGLIRIRSPDFVPTSDAPRHDQTRLAGTTHQPPHRQPDMGSRARRDWMASLSDADAEHNSILGIALPTHTKTSTTNLPPRLIPELQALAGSPYRSQIITQSTDDISSPSTIYTGSPSPWSASTTATTPISWSSASPSILQTSYSPVSNKRLQTVPVPTVTRLKTPKLPAVQERASTASLSNRFNPQDELSSTPVSRKSKKTPLSSPAPTPPPRSSSVKKTGSRSNSRTDEQYLVRDDAVPPVPALSGRDVAHSQQVQRDPFLDRIYSESPVTMNQQMSLEEILRVGPEVPRVKHTQANINSEAVYPLMGMPSASSTEPQTPISARSRLAKFSKLAMFGRSSKNTPVDDPKSNTRRQSRKGPQAGTGHEGYRKQSRRDRSLSTNGSNAASDSESSFVSTTRRLMRSTTRKDSSTSSRHSRNSQLELDDFAATRMKPVGMLGGSRRSVTDVRDSYSHIVNLASDVDTDLKSSPTRIATRSSAAVAKNQRTAHTDTNGSPEKPTLAQRRSRKLAIPETFPQLDRIATGNISAQPYVKTWNTSQSSVAQSITAMTDIGSDAYDTDVAEKQRKKSRKLKWNIFRKRDTDESKAFVQQRLADHSIRPQLQVTVAVASPEKPVPYYAMLDSEGEANTAETLERYLHEATRTADIDTAETGADPAIAYGSDGYTDRRMSVLLPAAPLFDRTIAPSKVTSLQVSHVDKTSPARSRPADEDARQPRLAQVGRIPKVITAHSVRQPNRMSFSRPFQLSHVADPRGSLHDTTYHDLTTNKADPSVPVKTLLDKPRLTIDSDFYANTSIHPNVAFATDAAQNLVHDAFKVADRQSTTSSSSDGMISVMGPPLIPFPEPIRGPQHPGPLADDVWKEYDDLIDHVTSPISADDSPSRLRYEGSTIQTARHRLADSFEMPAITLNSLQKELDIETSYEMIPMIYAAPDVFSRTDIENETHLRRSLIVSALNPSTAPPSPFSIGDYAGDVGHSARNSDPQSIRMSSSTASTPKTPSPRGSSATDTLVVSPPTPRHENSLHIDEVRRSRNPEKHSEMSYASLMVSRWLSFGRVLFSPGHLEVQGQTERHILVVDGLGNDDWSIYCAVTYQAEQAYVHDLKETGQRRAPLPRTNTGNTPPNLRRREVKSLYDPLKYPDNFFSVVVLRFPSAMAESKLRRVISECRRVLVPGGYLELMLLDLDIVNMGVLTRRALRSLKTKMSIADPGVSLRPVLDSFQNALGDEGFAKLSKCMVGVPVVGKPPEALDSPVSSRSSGGSEINRFNPSAGPQPLDGLRGLNNHNFSLNDLVADHSENADAKISKVVSRTARSWWQHCFEAAVINDGNLAQSLFADKQVLRECKARASSFKLLIAYTQKPAKPILELKRRTMSEPAVATLASA